MALLPSTIALPYYAVLDDAWMETVGPTSVQKQAFTFSQANYVPLSGNIDIVVAAQCQYVSGAGVGNPRSIFAQIFNGSIGLTAVKASFAQASDPQPSSTTSFTWSSEASSGFSLAAIGMSTVSLTMLPLYPGDSFAIVVGAADISDTGIQRTQFTVLHVPTGPSESRMRTPLHAADQVFI